MNSCPIPHRKKNGYVYLIKNIESCFKIGTSKTPNKRIKHLEVKLPFTIKTVHIFKCDDSISAEQKLHEHFKKHGRWINGEWFRLSEKDVKAFCQINRYKAKQFLTKDGKPIGVK